MRTLAIAAVLCAASAATAHANGHEGETECFATEAALLTRAAEIEAQIAAHEARRDEFLDFDDSQGVRWDDVVARFGTPNSMKFQPNAEGTGLEKAWLLYDRHTYKPAYGREAEGRCLRVSQSGVIYYRDVLIHPDDHHRFR